MKEMACSTNPPFQPGQRVICVNARLPLEAHTRDCPSLLGGRIYTVWQPPLRRYIETKRIGWSIKIQEIEYASEKEMTFSPRWDAARFRAIHCSEPATSQRNTRRLNALEPENPWETFQSSNSGLAALVFSQKIEEDISTEELHRRLRNLAQEKRRNLCAAVGLPRSERIVRLLAKLKRPTHYWTLILREILIADPNAEILLSRCSELTTRLIGQVTFGFRTENSSWVSEHQIPSFRWFFQLPLAQRLWLVGQWIELYRSPFSPDSILLKKQRNLGSFHKESQAVDYMRRRRSALEALGLAAPQTNLP